MTAIRLKQVLHIARLLQSITRLTQVREHEASRRRPDMMTSQPVVRHELVHMTEPISAGTTAPRAANSCALGSGLMTRGDVLFVWRSLKQGPVHEQRERPAA
jgi:hypothetical protein